MADARVEDLGSFDRDVARAWHALSAWRAKLAAAPDEHAEEDPIAPTRRVAGKSAWDALRAMGPSLADAPLREALVPWVGALTLARVGREDEVAVARAEGEARSPYRGEPPGLASWRDAWRGVVAARTPAEARIWLETAAEAATAVGDARRTAAATRVEVARRLGLAHPWDLSGAGDPVSLRGWARQLLDRTEDLTQAVCKEGVRGSVDAAEVLQLGLGREANEGWPARLLPRWLEELFGAHLSGLNVRLPLLPEARGAASFARALGLLGFSVRLAMAPAAMPFALARSPGSRAAHCLGQSFAALAADVEWQVRALGLGRRVALRQARVLARSALLDARLHAARLLLGDDASASPRDLLDELGPRLFGAPLDRRFAGAWPAARPDEPARFVALVESLELGRSLQASFDIDWFRNPRAWAHLRASASALLPEAPPGESFPAGIDAVARAFEGALG
jgi:hypothetical protein